MIRNKTKSCKIGSGTEARNTRQTMFVIALVAPRAFAQATPSAVETVAINIDSGMVAATGSASGSVVVFSQTITVSGARWMRLHFSTVVLGGSSGAGNESFLRITSATDGDVQTLDSLALNRWQNSSAYFAGDEVLVELFAYPNTGASSVMIDKIAIDAQGGSGEAATADICGTDDRVASNDPRTLRFRFFMPRSPFCNPVWEGWCTVFLFDGRPNWVLGAGHCCSALGSGADWNCEFPPVVESNVPPSNADGTANPSAVQDQYPG